MLSRSEPCFCGDLLAWRVYVRSKTSHATSYRQMPPPVIGLLSQAVLMMSLPKEDFVPVTGFARARRYDGHMARMIAQRKDMRKRYDKLR